MQANLIHGHRIPVATTGVYQESGKPAIAHYGFTGSKGLCSETGKSADLTKSSSGSSYTLSGPSSGYVAAPSSDFTVTLSGSVSGGVTITPSDGGFGGSFNPLSVTLSSGSATFTYTPFLPSVSSSGGSQPFVISTTNNKSLTQSSGNISFSTSGTVRYVSNKGTSGAGTFANPYGVPDLTAVSGGGNYQPSTACSVLSPGDTLFFRSGTYVFPGTSSSSSFETQQVSPTSSGTAARPITLSAFPWDISGSGTVSITYSGSNNQAPFGDEGPLVDYVRFIGFTITSSSDGNAAFMMGGNYGEIGYCEVIGVTVNTADNHDGIRCNFANGTWIHHCNVHGVKNTGTSDTQNGGGIKIYSSSNFIIEDNYVWNNSQALFDKEGRWGVSLSGTVNIPTAAAGSTITLVFSQAQSLDIGGIVLGWPRSGDPNETFYQITAMNSSTSWQAKVFSPGTFAGTSATAANYIAPNTGNNMTYRRNWVVATENVAFAGNNNIGGLCREIMYDNVFDGEVQLIVGVDFYGNYCSRWNLVYNNLFRTARATNNSTPIGGQDSIWNNVVINDGSDITAYGNQEADTQVGTINAPLVYMDYNFYDNTSSLGVSYYFNVYWADPNFWLSLSSGSSITQFDSFEAHSGQETTGTIYNGSWVLQAPYTTASGPGPSGQTDSGGPVGPRPLSPAGRNDLMMPITVSQILDSTRYGPSALPWS